MPLEGHPDLYASFRGVNYAFVEGYPEGNYFYDRGSVVANIHVAGEQIDLAINAFMGTQRIVEGLNGARTIERDLPHAWPIRPWMFVSGITHVKPMALMATDVMPFDASLPLPEHASFLGDKDLGTGTPRHRMGEISLLYTKPDYKVRSDAAVVNNVEDDDLQGLADEAYHLALGFANSRFVHLHVKRSGKMLEMPKGVLKANGKPIFAPIAINEAFSDWEYTWYQVPEDGLPKKAWLRGKNTVNHEEFDGHPPGTLLFCGDPDVRLNSNPLSEIDTYTVKYTFHSLCIVDVSVAEVDGMPVIRGHNYIRQVVDNKLVPQIFSTSGSATPAEDEKIFRDFDFRKFFRPDALVVTP